MTPRNHLNDPHPAAQPAGGLAATLDRWTCPALMVLLLGVIALLVGAYRRNVRLRTELATQTQRLQRFVAARAATAPALAAASGLATGGSAPMWVDALNANNTARATARGL